MNTQTILKIVGSVVLYLLLQILLIRNLVIFDVAFCFVYISIILFIPAEMPTGWLLLIAFLLGLGVDMFYNTAGIHASATVLIAYLKPYILKVLFPTKSIENEIVITMKGMGSERFIRYVIVMTFIHHLFLFFVEAGNFSFFLITILKVIASVIFSTIMIILLNTFFKSLQNN
jgi:hypothetical protein